MVDTDPERALAEQAQATADKKRPPRAKPKPAPEPPVAEEPPADEDHPPDFPVDAEIVDETPKRDNSTMGQVREVVGVAIARTEAKWETRLGYVRQGMDKLQADLQAQIAGQADEVREKFQRANDIFDKWQTKIDELAQETSGPADPGDLLAQMREELPKVAEHVLQGHLNGFSYELAEFRTVVQGILERENRESAGIYLPGTEAVMTLPSTAGGVREKVLALMRMVDEISKEREGSTGYRGEEKYAFRGVDDAMNAVGSAMRAVGLVMETEIVRESFELAQVPKMYNGQDKGVQLVSISRVLMRYTLIDPEDDSRHVMEMWGTARDHGDKDTSKAVSAAMKYALFQGLNIPVKGTQLDQTGTGTDPETDNPQVHADTVQRPQAPATPAVPSGPTPPAPDPEDPWDTEPPAAPEPPAPVPPPATPTAPSPPATPTAPAAISQNVQIGRSPENEDDNERLIKAASAARLAFTLTSIGEMNNVVMHAQKLGLMQIPVSINGHVQTLQSLLLFLVRPLQAAVAVGES